MVRYISILFAIMCSCVYAQEEKQPFVRGNMLKAALTFNIPSTMINNYCSNIYLMGDMEYFVDNHISFRGDGLWYIDAHSKEAYLKENSMLSFGAFYHLTVRKSDLFVGFQPGLSFTQLSEQRFGNNNLQASANIIMMMGCTYYFYEYLNFFINCRYITASYQGSESGTVKLNEFIMSGGLGWQLKFKKRDRYNYQQGDI